MKFLMAVLCLAMLSGCAHYHMISEVYPTSTAPQGLKVKIGSSEVKPGDEVVIYKTTCRAFANSLRGNAPQKCTRKTVGKARVMEVLDEKNAIIQADRPVEVNASMHVEKKMDVAMNCQE